MACSYSNDRIISEIEGLFKKRIPRFPKLPVPLLSFGAENRPGLNPKKITSDIISKFPEAGIDNGDNVWEKYTALVVNAIVDAIVYDSNIQVGIKPGAIQSVGVGGNAGGPVVVQSYNTMAGSGNATIS